MTNTIENIMIASTAHISTTALRALQLLRAQRLTLRARFAPTPSGFLHYGNAMSFVLTWLVVKLCGNADSTILLRIDDADAARKRPEYLQDIFETLLWLGLDYTDGPRSEEEFEDSWSQRHRMLLYGQVLERLCMYQNEPQNERRAHPVVFACECSRSQLRQLSSYPNLCASKALPLHTANTAVRLFVDAGHRVMFDDLWFGRCTVELGATIGSPIIRRRDGIPAYHVCSVVDDVLWSVNLVVRGEDLLPSTAAQIELACSLASLANAPALVFNGVEMQWDKFLQTLWLHHGLVKDELGRKLSKSDGALSVRALRAAGAARSDVLCRIGEFLGLSPVAWCSLEELQQAVEERWFASAL